MKKSVYQLAVLVVFSLTSILSAAATNWIGSVGNWSDSANWCNGVPTSSLYTIISDNGVVNVSGGAQSGYMIVGVGSSGTVNITGDLSVDKRIMLGVTGNATMTISNGAVLNNLSTAGPNDSGAVLANEFGSSASVTVDGAGSKWINNGYLTVGYKGYSTLTITNGAMVSNGLCSIASNGVSSAVVVSGAGSLWQNKSDLWVGGTWASGGSLTITDGALVSVAGELGIDYQENGNGFVNITTGGMLAIKGDADDSITQFLDELVSTGRGTDAINYWNGSDWANITEATMGVDYTLEYIDNGELSGFTKLTVANVPEPASIALFSIGLVSLLRSRK